MACVKRLVYTGGPVFEPCSHRTLSCAVQRNKCSASWCVRSCVVSEELGTWDQRLTSYSDWLTRANFKVHPVLLQHTEQSEQVWHQIYKVSSWFLLTRVEKNRLPDSRKIFMHVEEQKKNHIKAVQRVMSGLKGGGWFPRTTKKEFPQTWVTTMTILQKKKLTYLRLWMQWALSRWRQVKFFYHSQCAYLLHDTHSDSRIQTSTAHTG